MGTDIHPYVEVRRDGRWRPEELRVPDDRNYWAFAVLAGVRNGYGFAGVPTGTVVTPISEPRGIPEDCSLPFDENGNCPHSEDAWLGDHSYSWVLLSELLAVNLDTTIMQRGYVRAAAAEQYRTAGTLPDEWCGGTNAQGWVPLAWPRRLGDAAWLLPKIIAVLQLCNAPPEDVRLVFGFDS